MRNLLHGAPEATWYADLRHAAVKATADSHRSLWLAGLAAAGVVLFIVVLVGSPAGLPATSPALDDFRRLAERNQPLAAGIPTTDGLQSVASPIWFLLLARFSGDVALAARILGGLSAVVALFAAYQLCHGLSSEDDADQQSCFALLALALSPGFLLAAAGGGTEIPHLALLLAGLFCLQRALGPEAALTPLILSGLLIGLSALVRPISLLVPLAVGLWLWQSRPYAPGERSGNLCGGLAFAAAFLVGASPLLALSLTRQTSPFAWSVADFAAVGARVMADPLGMLSAAGWTILEYAGADDLERLGAIVGSWQAGAWGSLIGAMIATGPTILKLLGVLGLVCVCWIEGFTPGGERGRLPALLLVLLLLGGAAGLVDERGGLPVGALLLIFAFAGLPSLVPSIAGGVLSLGLLTLLVFSQFGVGSDSLAAARRARDLVAAPLHEAGATPGQVMASSWAFYDTRSSWRERYRHIPAYVDGIDGLVAEMKRQGTRYLVFDRRSGGQQWPRLTGLAEAERPPAGLKPLQPPLRTDESPPNVITIYRLE